MMTVAICTRQRPILLRKMLESCVKIRPDPRTDIQFIVVENGPREQAETIVRDFTDRLDIRYVHAPEVGLVNARNAAIEAFLEGGADWMASFDDDLVVDPDWLHNMVDVMQAYPGDVVFAGRQLRILEDGSISKYHLIGPAFGSKNGIVNWNSSTANMVFHRSVFTSDGLTMRFHPVFNLTGGEDTYFALSLKDKGVNIRWVEDAIVREDIHEERTELAIHIKRGINNANSMGQIQILRFGKIRGRLYCLVLGGLSMVNVVTYTFLSLLSLIIFPFHKGTTEKLWYSAQKSAFSSIGVLRAIFFEAKPLYAETAGL